jgi:hypothetical protein
MGLDRTIHYSVPQTPSWAAIQGELARVDVAVELRIIDGLPAFPDETPDDGWKELRIGTSAGMITLRRREGAITCVVWGNADETLSAVWSKVIWACATAAKGHIQLPSGPISADRFAQSIDLVPRAR